MPDVFKALVIDDDVRSSGEHDQACLAPARSTPYNLLRLKAMHLKSDVAPAGALRCDAKHAAGRVRSAGPDQKLAHDGSISCKLAADASRRRVLRPRAAKTLGFATAGSCSASTITHPA